VLDHRTPRERHQSLVEATHAAGLAPGEDEPGDGRAPAIGDGS